MYANKKSLFSHHTYIVVNINIYIIILFYTSFFVSSFNCLRDGIFPKLSCSSIVIGHMKFAALVIGSLSSALCGAAVA